MTLCLVNPGCIRLAWSVDVQGLATAALCRTHHFVQIILSMTPLFEATELDIHK